MRASTAKIDGRAGAEVEMADPGGRVQTCPCGWTALEVTERDEKIHDVSDRRKPMLRVSRGRLSMVRSPHTGQTRRSIPVSARTNSRQDGVGCGVGA